jgi:hypothetical protein
MEVGPSVQPLATALLNDRAVDVHDKMGGVPGAQHEHVLHFRKTHVDPLRSVPKAYQF